MLAIKVSLMQSMHRNVIQIALRSCSQHKDIKGPANSEQLHKICNSLSETLPKFFVETHNYHLYNSQIVFEDNIRNVRTHGINNYMKRLVFLKVMGHLKYSHVRMDVLKITQHPEDSTVRVRWRVIGVPGLKIIYMFWNYKLWNRNKLYGDQNSEWIDGFSIFYVGNDGLIHRHVCDKVMPDEERSQVKDNSNIGVKLALMLGLAPHSLQEALFEDLYPLLSNLRHLFIYPQKFN